MKIIANVNPFYLISGLYLAGGGLFLLLMALGNLQAIPPVPGVTWLRIHIVTIGAVTQALFGAVPALAAARLGVEGQPAGAAWRQWSLVNVGLVMLLIGMPASPRHIFMSVAGATLIFLAVLSLVNNLYGMARRSPEGAGNGTRFYLTAPVFLLLGITLAVSMLLGWPAPGGYAGTREAHIHANIWGFTSLAAAGLLLDLMPALTGKPLARPGWVSTTYWLMTVGAALLVAGPWLKSTPIMMAGMLPFLIATVLLLWNVNLSRDRNGPMPVRAIQLLAPYIWVFAPILAAPVMHLMPGTLPTAAVETAALQGLAFGWALQLIVTLLPVLLGGLARRDQAGLSLGGKIPDAPLLGVFALTAGPALIWAGNLSGMDAVIGAGYALIALGLLPALAQVWRFATAPGAPEAGAGNGA